MITTLIPSLFVIGGLGHPSPRRPGDILWRSALQSQEGYLNADHP